MQSKEILVNNVGPCLTGQGASCVQRTQLVQGGQAQSIAGSSMHVVTSLELLIAFLLDGLHALLVHRFLVYKVTAAAAAAAAALNCRLLLPVKHAQVRYSGTQQIGAMAVQVA